MSFPNQYQFHWCRQTVVAMKLTAILILVACLQVSARGYTQESVTLNEKNADLASVLKKITNQTGVHFLHRDEWLKDAKPVNISVKNRDLATVLQILFKEQPTLTYERVSAEMVAVKQKQEKKDDNNNIASPPIDIHGRVVNEKGEPVEGVTVMVKGTKVATSTNANGEFSLATVDPDAVLVFTSVNMETFELVVSGKTDLAVSLKTKVTALGDVTVVNTGYQALKPNEVTGSVAHINNELFNRRVSTDVLSRLEGVASGVLFNGRNTNALKNVSIRGTSTINANTDVLYVVDNFPYTGDINLLNPNDIESVTVLKDAGSASIWGAFSGNGVIVITTKKGKFNQGAKISFNTSVTIGDKPDLFYDPGFLNSNDFINVESFLFSKGLYFPDTANVNRPPLSPAVEIFLKRRYGQISAADSAAQINALKTLDVRGDYEEYLYRKAVNQQYSLSISGGSNKASYFLSGGYNKDISNIVGNQGDRLSFNSVSTFRPLKNLEISGRLIYTQTNSENNGMENITSVNRYTNIYPYAQLADANGKPLPVIKNHRITFAQNPQAQGLLNWLYYPLNELKYADNTTKGNNNILSADIKYTVIKGLNLQFQYTYQKDATEFRSYSSEQTYSVRNTINRYSVVTNGVVTKRNVPLGSTLLVNRNTNWSNAGRLVLDFGNTWGKHRIKGISGIDVREVKTEGYSTGVYGYDINVGTYTALLNYDSLYRVYPIGTARIPLLGNGVIPFTLRRFRSYFGNVLYTYDNRYSFSTSARLDQANIFGAKANKRGKPLWSAGLLWHIDQEKFYKINWLDLNFKITYGYNGNFDQRTAAFTTANYSSADPINPTLPFASVITPGNPQLGWEKMGMLNVGVDFRVKNFLTGSIEYFRKSGVGMIGDAFIPSSTGYFTVTGNFADMKGSGVDLVLNGNLNTKIINWSSTLLFSYAADEITRNDGNTGKVVGKPVNSLFTYRWGGLDANGDPLGYLNDTLSKNYGLIISTTTTKPETRKYNGSGIPVIFGSFRNTIEWNGFSVSANIIYKAKYYFQRTSIRYGGLYNSSAGHVDFTRRWQKAGDETKTNVPAMVYTDYPQFANRDQFYGGSDALVEKGDHIRLKDVTFNYTISKLKFTKLPFDQIDLYFYADNLGIIWKANNSGLDPDFSTGYPRPKTYSFGIRASL